MPEGLLLLAPPMLLPFGEVGAGIVNDVEVEAETEEAGEKEEERGARSA